MARVLPPTARRPVRPGRGCSMPRDLPVGEDIAWSCLLPAPVLAWMEPRAEQFGDAWLAAIYSPDNKPFGRLGRPAGLTQQRLDGGRATGYPAPELRRHF